jgi:threonine synthase
VDYISTRGEYGSLSSQAILQGIAKDGGLYVPASFPILSKNELESLIPLEYYERSAYIIGKFLTDYSQKDLETYTKKAYSRFDGDPAPVLKLDDEIYILELFHGPTYAFKDIALTLLPHLLVGARKQLKVKEKTLILVATSGDTGKAALEGFKDVDGTEIVVIYPADGVSEMQKLQMQTAAGENVHVIGINGNFDDAQAAVKRIFGSEEANERFASMGYSLSSANSINWGRLVPQIVYYFSAYLDMVGSEEIKMGDKVNFAVPTGNFGNILAGYYAKRMGLPVNKLIVASNKNNVLTDFFNKGEYNANREFYKTMSPSMDILVSSNLERLLFELYDRDFERIIDLMEKLKYDKSYLVDVEDIEEKLSEFIAYDTNEEDTLETIKDIELMFGYVMDPHTAVGANALYLYLGDSNDKHKSVLVSTASPYKFASDVVYALEGVKVEGFKAVKKLNDCTALEVPKQIQELKSLEKRHTLVVDNSEIEETIYKLLEK